MEFKDEGNISIKKGSKKKIKCHKVFCKPLNREVMIHENTDDKKQTTVSDFITGYRMFDIPIEPIYVEPSHVKEGFKNFVKHYTIEGIEEEFKRIEKLISEEKTVTNGTRR